MSQIPTAADLRSRINTEYSPEQWQAWLNEGGYRGNDAGGNCPQDKPFKTSKKVSGGDPNACVDHPDACPPGTTAWGINECVAIGSRPNSGGGTGGGAGGGRGNLASLAGGVPQFSADQFKAPSYQEAMNDPGYQFALQQGEQGINRNAAALGTARTGGNLKDLAQFNQGLAAQQYGNVFNRALQGYGANYQLAKDIFAPKYGAWQLGQQQDLSRWTTRYGGNLQRDLQQEQNIYNLLNQPTPVYGGY